VCELLSSADIYCFVLHPLLTSIYAQREQENRLQQRLRILYEYLDTAKVQDSVSVQFNGDGILVVAVQRHAM
jgi:hypothetical protein